MKKNITSNDIISIIKYDIDIEIIESFILNIYSYNYLSQRMNSLIIK